MTFAEFYQQLQQLKDQHPAIPTHSHRGENCDYGDYIYTSKNLYLAFDCAQCEDSFYLYDSFKAKNCLDGDYVIESELLYQATDPFHCYNSAYINYCARVYDCYYCYDCMDSHDSVGCTHLAHKQYCIFNRQYTKEEYLIKKAEVLKRPPEENLKALQELIDRFPMTETNVTHSENCDYGNHVHYSHNLYLCFDAAHCENCGYLYDSHHNKNSYDLTQSVYCELSYQCVDSSRLFNCIYLTGCENCYNSSFCFNCYDSDHLFGCVGLRKKKYYFLNKPYPKEVWEKMIEEAMDSFRQAAR